MNKENYISIIDFGSSKIRFSVFDSNLNEKFLESSDAILESDYSNHFKKINHIVKLAEKKISSHIQDIILTIDPNDLFTVAISIEKKQDEKSELSKIYANAVLELDQLIQLHYNSYKIIHVLLDECIIDEKIYVDLPKDKDQINNIKFNFKIICFNKKNLDYLLNLFKKNNLNVKCVFCTSYVKSLYYSNKFNIDNTSFLDIGWGRTTIVNFKNKKCKLIQSIPVGSVHITKDISKIFSISLSDAENIKKSFNKSETVFSYGNNNFDKNNYLRELLTKNISIDKLKKVILYRIQEIIDLSLTGLNKSNKNFDFKNTELFLIGQGSLLLKNNTFYLNDEIGFKSINFYQDTDKSLFKSILNFYLNNNQVPKKVSKKQGLFEKFFNFFDK